MRGRCWVGAGEAALKVGIVLPQFREGAEPALKVAMAAEANGLDGVFVYDHLWMPGHPGTPALSSFPLLGAVAVVTEKVHLGPLVARIGLVPDGVLVAEMSTLALIAPGRVVAGLGAGDSTGAAEQRAYGIPLLDRDARLNSLSRCARELAALGIPVWIGTRSARTAAMARSLGAAVNLWKASPAEVRTAAAEGEVTWAGPVLRDPKGACDLLEALQGAGASWAVLLRTDDRHGWAGTPGERARAQAEDLRFAVEVADAARRCCTR